MRPRGRPWRAPEPQCVRRAMSGGLPYDRVRWGRENVRLEHREGKGRCLVAARPVARGKTVFVEDPFAAVLHDEALEDYCAWTFKKSDSLMRCARSKLYRYSSQDALKAHFENGYKEEAKALKRRLPATTTTRLVSCIARELLGRTVPLKEAMGPRGEEGYATLVHGAMRDFASDCRLSDDMKMAWASKARVSAALVEAGAPDCDKGSGMVALSDDARGKLIKGCYHLMCVVLCNCHTVSDGHDDGIGTALYFLGSSMNHDDDPNAVHVFRGRQLHIVAGQDIRPGDEICIVYEDLEQLAAQRRIALLTPLSHNFDSCPPTVQPRPPLGVPPEAVDAWKLGSVADRSGPPGAAGYGAEREEVILHDCPLSEALWTVDRDERLTLMEGPGGATCHVAVLTPKCLTVPPDALCGPPPPRYVHVAQWFRRSDVAGPRLPESELRSAASVALMMGKMNDGMDMACEWGRHDLLPRAAMDAFRRTQERWRCAPAHFLMQRAKRQSLDRLVQSKWFREALAPARERAQVERWAWPEEWPLLGLTFARLAKLEMLEGDAGAARDAARRAVHLLGDAMSAEVKAEVDGVLAAAAAAGAS
ncbi:unnamed protein product [Pedinophyceae sp. YPF-701]|nr:unnamed protein product [Pedinophyceae sp. YPF-701]